MLPKTSSLPLTPALSPTGPTGGEGARRPITIVGGGLAGLTLGIGLRQRGVPVIVWEAGGYPRHRVCGEFISGRGIASLRQLGLLSLLEAAGARPAHSAAFYIRGRLLARHRLPEPAVCISRFVLDQLQADAFLRLGGTLHTGERWPRAADTEGVVNAGGRQPPKSARHAWHWYGLKAHLRDLPLSADLEMHLEANSYVGLCRLGAGTVNVCGLFRRRASDPGVPKDFKARFTSGASCELQERLGQATWEEDSYCTVATVPIQGSVRPASSGCRIGDALGVTAPFTGNGMSMAFESAQLATAPLVEFAEGSCPWEVARRSIAERLRERFGRRLFWSGLVNTALFHGPLRGALLTPLLRSVLPWRLLFLVTR